MTEPAEVLDFWFAGDATTHRDAWFTKDPDFDASCGRFAEALAAARRGALDEWADTPSGALALVILLDQFSRNLFRNSPEAYAADSKARVVARAAIAQGFDQAVGPVERMFFYLPFEHSEDLTEQDESVQLFEPLRAAIGDDSTDYAARHRDVIRRFGRFPHRNAVLGRASTPEEERHLAEHRSGF